MESFNVPEKKEEVIVAIEKAPFGEPCLFKGKAGTISILECESVLTYPIPTTVRAILDKANGEICLITLDVKSHIDSIPHIVIIYCTGFRRKIKFEKSQDAGNFNFVSYYFVNPGLRHNSFKDMIISCNQDFKIGLYTTEELAAQRKHTNQLIEYSEREEQEAKPFEEIGNPSYLYKYPHPNA